MNFRKDINGLRAFAVLSVVFFHFGIPGFNGGFIGVDVFFVISGYLMTGIIFRKIDDGTFSIRDFYLDRARRIIPALSVLCLTLLLTGWLFLTPTSYRTLGKHAASSLGFLSNFVYLLEDNYFAESSRTKWLLHTWSLSVEWQFYIIYPPIVIIAIKLLKERTTWLISGLTCISLLLSIWLSSRSPGIAFYLLPTRGWELLAGGLVYLFKINPPGRSKILLEMAGLAMVTFSAIFFTPSHIWPGWLAIFPVLGAMFVIASNRTDSPLTGNSIAQFIGTTSYSIYLWHWPLVVGLYYYNKIDTTVWKAGGVAASLAIGWASYAFIESHTKIKGNTGRRFSSLFKTLAPAALTAVAGGFIFTSNGIPGRMPNSFKAKTRDLVMPLATNGWCFYSVDSISSLRVGTNGLQCELGDKLSSTRGLSFGDSFSGHNDPFWDAIGSKNHVKINSVSTNWCYPSTTQDFPGPTFSKSHDQCKINRDYLRNHIGEYDFVILSGSWAGVYARRKMEDVNEVIKLASTKTRLTIIMAAPTTFDEDPVFRYENSLLLGMPFDINHISKANDTLTRQANAELKRIAETYDNVLYIDRDSLFNINGRPSDVTIDNIPYSFGGNHISVYGSKAAVLAFEKTPLYSELQSRFSRIKAKQ